MSDLTTEVIQHESTHEAMVAIMRDLDHIAKERQADQSMGGYKFRGYEDVLQALAPACRRHGLLTPIICGELQMREYTTKGGTIMHWPTIPVAVHFQATKDPEDTVVSSTEGEAADTGDKAVSKAVSVAYREIMLKTFVVPVAGMDYDTETGEDKAAGRSEPDAPEFDYTVLGWDDADDFEKGWTDLKAMCAAPGESGEWAGAWCRGHKVTKGNLKASFVAEMFVTMAGAKKDGDWKANFEPPEPPEVPTDG